MLDAVTASQLAGTKGSKLFSFANSSKYFRTFFAFLQYPLGFRITSLRKGETIYCIEKVNIDRLKRKYISTFCRRVFAFPPIIYYVLPGDVGSQSMEGRKLGLLAGQQESMVLERDYVAFLWLPSLAKLGCASSGNKSYSAWPKNG